MPKNDQQGGPRGGQSKADNIASQKNQNSGQHSSADAKRHAAGHREDLSQSGKSSRPGEHRTDASQGGADMIYRGSPNRKGENVEDLESDANAPGRSQGVDSSSQKNEPSQTRSSGSQQTQNRGSQSGR